MTSTVALYLCLLAFIFAHLVEPQMFGSMCTNRQFRRLSLKLQNEHQCLQMEQIQSETLMERNDRRKRHRESVELLMLLDAKVDNLLYDLSDNVEIWEEKWARKLKERSKTNGQINLFDTASDEDSGEDSDCSNTICTSNAFLPNTDMRPIPHDCYEWMQAGEKVSGVYPLRLPTERILLAYCDMETAGGGWTVVQRRVDGTVSFNRNWITYRDGFGNPNSEFWLGNEYLYQMTTSKNYSLQIDMWDWKDEQASAHYSVFRVGSEAENYPLNVRRYRGDAGDSLQYHNNVNFSTPDRDNDAWFGSCAKRDRAGWWFKDCSFASLNSQYHDLYNSVGPNSLRDGILWYHWKKDESQSLRKVEMKIRPAF